MLLSTGIYIITLFFSIVLGLFVLIDNHKNRINQFFCLLIFSLVFWILCNVLIDIANDFSLQFARISIIFVALLPIFFNQFIKHLYFPNDVNYGNSNRIVFYLSSAVTAIIIFLSQTIYNVKNISFEPWGVDYEPGMLYIILFFYLLIAFGFSFFHLFKISLDAQNPKRGQAKFILAGASITLVLSIFSNIVLPFMGYGFFNIFGPFTVLIFLSFIAYSITRHHLFDIKVIALEVVTFGLWITILIRTMLADTLQERLVEVGILAITIIFGISLIRSTLHVIRQREYIEKLAEKLQKAYVSLETLNDHLEQKVTKKMK